MAGARFKSSKCAKIAGYLGALDEPWQADLPPAPDLPVMTERPRKVSVA
jgi:hypothetical protein